MSIWYDSKGKAYASDGSTIWAKSYIDFLADEKKAEFEAELNSHYNGTRNRHLADGIDYTNNKTVKDAIDTLNSGLAKESETRQSEDTALRNAITLERDERSEAVSELQTAVNSHIDSVSKATESLQTGLDIVSYELFDLNSRVESDAEKVENKGVAGGYAPLDENGKVADPYLYSANVKRYGIRWEGTSSTACERLGNAVGLVANAHMGTTDSVQNDFDNIYPWSEMRLCNIDAEGNVLAYIDEPNFARDGSNGDVMVEIPKFYYKRVKTGSAEELWISGELLYGYELHPVFLNDGVEVDRVFCSAYDVSTAVDDNGVTYAKSVSGDQPAVRDRKEEFRAYARAKGENWGIEDLSSISALQMLYLVEYADTNSQKMLGGGATNIPDDLAPRNGSCDKLNGESGYIGTYGLADVNYRGIEGFNGKNSRFIDGVNIKDWQVYFANSTADYADEVYDGKYTAVGYTNATSNGYISEFGYDENYPWVMFPIKTTGSSTTYIPDYYYQASGKRSLMVGGHFARGAGAGAFFSSCDTEIETNYYNIGAHLLLKKPQGGNI